MAVIEQDMIRVRPAPMIAPTLTITETAASRLLGMMKEKELGNYGLRVFVSGGGCSGMQYGMTFDDEVREGDNEWNAYGLRVLVDPVSAGYLRGASIDYQQDNMLAGAFKIDNPNAVGQLWLRPLVPRQGRGGGVGVRGLRRRLCRRRLRPLWQRLAYPGSA